MALPFTQASQLLSTNYIRAIEAELAACTGVLRSSLGAPPARAGRCAYCATRQPAAAVHCESCGAPQ